MTPVQCGRLFLWAGMIAAVMSPSVRADTVTLNDGTSLEGTIEIETATNVVLKLADGTRVIRKADIASTARSSRETVAPPEAAQAAEPSSAVRAQNFNEFKSSGVDADPIAKRVVRVYATIAAPDFMKPWSRLAPHPKTSSGWLSGSGQVVTTAEAAP